MKRITIFVLIISLASIFTLNSFAQSTKAFTFSIDGTEITITSEENISSDFAFEIAEKVLNGNNAVSKGVYCDNFGHSYVSSTTKTTTHKVYTTAPRCVKKIYSVKTCSVCGYQTKTLTSSTRINCCS